MDVSELPRDATTIYALSPDRPLSLHLPSGVAVCAVSGTVWLTQDGLIEDVLLAPGERYETGKKGHVVLNALGRSASVYIVRSPETSSSRGAVTPELVAAIEAKARRLRQQEISRMLNVAGAWVVRAVRVLKGTFHRSLNTRSSSTVADPK